MGRDKKACADAALLERFHRVGTVEGAVTPVTEEKPEDEHRQSHFLALPPYRFYWGIPPPLLQFLLSL